MSKNTVMSCPVISWVLSGLLRGLLRGLLSGLLRGLFGLLGVVLLLGCGSNATSRSVDPVISGSASSAPQIPGTTNPRIEQTNIVSAVTGITYPVHIYLPEDYASSNKSYPVIYATDGQWIFNGFAAALDDKSLDVILVAIEQGPNDRRSVDYLLPGARQYFLFLTTELLPTIERDYRVDTTQRTLSGTSYGGILVAAVLLLDDVVQPHFRNYLSFDASFYVHPHATADLQTERYNASHELPATLVLTSATKIGNDAHVTSFQRKLEARNFNGLKIYRKKYAVHHNNVAEPSFADALDLIFPTE